MKIIINASSCAFRLHRPVLEELWEKHPELFDEPLPSAEFDDFRVEGDTRSIAERFDWAVERNGMAHFLTLNSPALRRLPSLVARVEQGEDIGKGLKVVNAPDDVEWYIYVEEDGREFVLRTDSTSLPD